MGSATLKKQAVGFFGGGGGGGTEVERLAYLVFV